MTPAPERLRQASIEAANRLEWVTAQELEDAASTIEAMQKRLDDLLNLLKRIHDWDHMDSAGDGPYWREEIRNAVAPLGRVTDDDIRWASAQLSDDEEEGENI